MPIGVRSAANLELFVAAFHSGDRERLSRAIEEADSPEVQNKLSRLERAELNDLISEVCRRLFMDGFA